MNRTAAEPLFRKLSEQKAFFSGNPSHGRQKTVELSTYLYQVQRGKRCPTSHLAFELEGSLPNSGGMFSKITSFFSPIFSRSIQALCPVFSRHVSLRYLSDSKRFLYREILPELPTCTREIHDGWRASGANEPFLGSHYSLLGTKYSFRGTKIVFRDNKESLLGAKHSFRGTKLGFRDTNECILEAKHSLRGTNIVSEDTNEVSMIQNEIQMPIG